MGSTDRLASTVTLVALVGAAAAIVRLHIEQSLGLPRLMPWVVAGAVVHALLPMRFRMGFFLALGVAGLFGVFGPTGGAMLLGAGLTLIGACHLPIPHRARVAVVAVLATGLAAARLGWVEVPTAPMLLPMLGSMFMFRLIIYLYDLRHERRPVPVQARLAYFFMLPNLCFPLFPVVDYQRFTASHYATDADAIYRKGVGWLLLGTTHVLAYRVLHLFVIPDPAEVQDLQGVILYVVTAYLQYVRISGMFHIAAGILCLFGFHMPATNRWFFFASSFSELWRSINIYWKDFLQKLVYFPVFMSLRKKQGHTRAVALATGAVFVASWALHAWQWFWLQGEVLIWGMDLVFWAVVGVGVVVSSLAESRKKTDDTPRSPLRQAVDRMVSMAFVFGPTALMWSLWSSESVTEWLYVMGQARHVDAAAALRVAGGLAAVFATGVGLSWLHLQERLPDVGPVLSTGPALVGSAGVLVLAGFAAPQLPEDSELLALTLESPQGAIGYYEGLMQADEAPARDDAFARETGPESGFNLYKDQQLTVPTDDLRLARLRPSLSGTLDGHPFTTNRHGMRDTEVSQARTPGVVRVALLGASPEMGWGVADGEDFPALLDDALGPEVEILNFAMAGYSPVQQISVAEEALRRFDPDLLMLITHCEADAVLTQRLLMRLAAQGPPLPPELEDHVPWKTKGAAAKRAAIADEIEPLTRWAYLRIASLSEQHGALPLWTFLRLPNSTRCSGPRPEEAKAWAREAGLETLRLRGIFVGHDQAALSLKGVHPTAQAHRMIAEHLLPELAPWLDKVRERPKE